MKRSIIFLLTFAIFSFVFASCSDLARDASAGGLGTAAGAANGGSGGTAAAQKYASVTGTAFASGAFPEEIAAALNKIPASSAGMTNSPGISKSAFPSLSDAYLLYLNYKITAVKVGDESVHYDVAESDIKKDIAAASVSYSVNIPVLDAAVQYKIVCEAYQGDDAANIALAGESESFAISRDKQAASVDVRLGAVKESGATGGVDLTVAYETDEIDFATVTIGGVDVPGTIISGAGLIDFRSAGDAPTGVPCGAHLARFSFKKGSEEVYAFTQVVNVFKNLWTSAWVQNGAEPYFTTAPDASGNKYTTCKLTSALLKSWTLTDFFVDETRSSDPTKPNYSSQSGSFLNPCLTFDAAVSKLLDSSKDYTIYINGTVTGAQAVPSGIQARSLTICGANGLYTSGPNAGQPKDTLDADGIGSALCVQTNVAVSIKDLRITGADDDGVSGLAILDDGVNVTLLDGTLITGNESDKGGGVRISAGSLAIKGAVISGNAATEEGGGIYNDGGSVTFYSGSIESNSALCYGGGVSNNSGSFEMKDGACIKENSANDGGDGTYSDGGGVFVYGGSFTMSGGTISGNSTNGRGGAVYVFGGSFSVGGSVSIPYGTGNDIYLESDQSIAIASALNSNFAVLITLPDDDYKTGTQVLSGTEELLDSECLKFNVFQPESASQFLFVGSQGKLRTLISFPNGTQDGTEINEDDSLSYDVYKYSYRSYDNLSMSVVNPYEALGYIMQVKVDGETPEDLDKLADGFHTVYAKIEKEGEPTIEATSRICVKIKPITLKYRNYSGGGLLGHIGIFIGGFGRGDLSLRGRVTIDGEWVFDYQGSNYGCEADVWASLDGDSDGRSYARTLYSKSDKVTLYMYDLRDEGNGHLNGDWSKTRSLSEMKHVEIPEMRWSAGALSCDWTLWSERYTDPEGQYGALFVNFNVTE